MDLVDTTLVWLLLWAGIVWLRSNPARVALIGLAMLGVVYLVARQLGLVLMTWILQGFFAVSVLVAVVVFHTLTGALLPIGVFPIVMALSATIFFEPDWPRRFIGSPSPTEEASPPVSTPLDLWQKLGFALLGAHFVFQLAFPWRQLAYPGNVCWTEQGFRFSWHVMLMEKTGQVDFRVVDEPSGKRWVVYPRERLSPIQHRMMSTQPDMILSFAHHLHDEWKAKGYPDVAVYADAWASLNGRRRQRLIDPAVDLAREEEGWANKTWIVPLEDTAEARRE